MRLSRKALMEKPEGYVEPERRPRPLAETPRRPSPLRRQGQKQTLRKRRRKQPPLNATAAVNAQPNSSLLGSCFYIFTVTQRSKTMKNFYLTALAGLLLVTASHCKSPTEYTKGVGLYPGNPSQDYAPALIIDAKHTGT